MTDNNTATPSNKRPRRMSREPEAVEADHALPKRATKINTVLAMLRRLEGATLEQLVAATGWLPHTTRAAMTGLRKKGHVITSDKPAGGVRTYCIERVEEASR